MEICAASRRIVTPTAFMRTHAHTDKTEEKKANSGEEEEAEKRKKKKGQSSPDEAGNSRPIPPLPPFLFPVPMMGLRCIEMVLRPASTLGLLVTFV